MFTRLRSFVKRHFPLLRIAYRAMRSERLASATPILTPHGFLLVAENTSMTVGTFERAEIDLLRAELDDSDVFVDIGANVGLYTCLAARTGKHVIAIEPLASNVAVLLHNLAVNKLTEVEVFPIALSSAPGLLTLYGSGTGASVIKGWAGTSAIDGACLVPVNSLDALIADRFAGKRLIIKIDVEGHETDLLTGAVRTLAMNPKPRWLIEVIPEEHHPSGANPSYVRTFETLWRAGYCSYTADTTRRPVQRDHVVDWATKGRVEFGSHNYWSVHPRSEA
ncbi:MAG: FkbM family methyltransferase [Terriglobales bacterium]